MKVKIMDYEIAKAEVLARKDNNPYFANDRTVLGIGYRWEGWGQVRDVDKDTDYANNVFVFRDVEDNFDFPNYLIANITAKDVLRYGEIIIDEEIYDYCRVKAYDEPVCVRLRVISYNGSLYWLKQKDGEIVEFKEIGLAMK